MSNQITTIKNSIKKLQRDFTFIGENFADFDNQDLINYHNFIATTLKSINATLSKLDSPKDNYCILVLNEYLAYIRESLDEYGWILPDNHHPDPTTIKKIFTRIFVGERSTKHTPFVNSLENTFASFSKFCNAIYRDENNELDADTAEVLLRAIKNHNVAKMKAILIKDLSLLTRVYSLNNSIDEFGFTPLMYAAKYCDAKIIHDGLFSVIKGKKEILIYISNKIKDENSQFQSYNLNMIAARWGQSATFRIFSIT